MTRLRISLKMTSADAYELKAQALNKDPRLKEVGIAALKFSEDGQYIADGEFTEDAPPPAAPTAAPAKPATDSTPTPKLRVMLRMTDQHSYELKAQALNNDSRLKKAGVVALKFTENGQYIVNGELTAGLPRDPGPKLDTQVRVVLKAPTKAAYELVTRHLNGDPELKKLGIAGVGLIKGGGIAPVAKAPEKPTQPPKKKLRWAMPAIGVLVALVIVGGASALFFSGPPEPTPAPTATEAVILPIVQASTSTHTPFPPTETVIPSTATKAATKTPLPTATTTSTPTATTLACVPPTEVVVFAENLSCRYGPGAPYLYRTGLAKGDIVDVLGKADTAYGTWIYVQTRWETPVKCWINSGPRYVEVSQGDVDCLEPYYPEKAPLIIFDTSPYPADRFPAPSKVEASRVGDVVNIQWVGKELLPGDLPENSPPYLVETWTCQGGEIVFSPQGWYTPYALVKDEAGCSEPSYGYVYMAHVDGYVGPSIIPWPK